MKIEDKTYVETTMSGGTAFGIEDSPKIFKVLSKNIYKNPIMAFIRELTTNAADAHIDAKTTHIPIDIKLPSKLDPSFFVRDYGTGMSHENLLLIYKTYFKSTKSDDNNTDGMYGLGSKSPFAYSNDFTVECYYNGVKYAYLAMFDQNDRPQFVPIEVDVPTSEKNGIKVTVTVKQNDFDRIYQEAQRVLLFVDAKINIIGDMNGFDLQKQKQAFNTCKIFENDDVIITSQNAARGMSNISVFNIIQGNVCYPVDFSTIDSIIGVSSLASNSNGYRYFFKFDRGEINVPPSREEISYDRVYVDKVIKKSEKVIDTISSKITTDLKKVKTVYEYISFIRDIQKKGTFGAFSGLFFSREDSGAKADSINTEISFPNPFDDTKTITRKRVLTDIQNGNALKEIVYACAVKFPIGTTIMSSATRGYMTTSGIKVDEYKANPEIFETQLILNSMHLSVDETWCESELKATNKPYREYSSSRQPYSGRGLMFVTQDTDRPLTMIHFTKLMSNSMFGDNIYFMKNIDVKKIAFCQGVALKLLIAAGMDYEANSMKSKHFNSMTSSKMWSDHLSTRTDVFRGIDISVATLQRKNIEQYGSIDFSKSTITDAEACQQTIESGKYLIARTYGHEADVTLKLFGNEVKVTDKDDISALIAMLFAMERNASLAQIDGVIFIKKTSYDKLAKKEVDMTNLVDTHIANLITKHTTLLDYVDVNTNQYSVDCYKKIADILKSHGKRDIIVETVESVHSVIDEFNKIVKLANVGAHQSHYRNVIQGIILAGIKCAKKFSSGHKSSINVPSAIRKINDKYPVIHLMNSASLVNAANTLAAYVIQTNEYERLKFEEDARQGLVA